MQIRNTSFQLVDYSSSVEKAAAKPEKREVKTKSELGSNVSDKGSDKLEELTKALEESNISLNFSQDQDTQILVVKLVDKETGEAIRQIPNEVSLKLAAINAKMQGNFVDEQS